MANEDKQVRRILHFRFTLPDASAEMLAMMKSASPFFGMFGNAKMRLLRNADDPKRFIQELDYETPETIETNRQKVASDPMVQAVHQDDVVSALLSRSKVYALRALSMEEIVTLLERGLTALEL